MILKLKLFCQKVLLHMEVHKTSEEPLNLNPSSQYLTLLFLHILQLTKWIAELVNINWFQLGSFAIKLTK